MVAWNPGRNYFTGIMPVSYTHLDVYKRQVLTLIADFRKELDKRTIGPRGRQVLDHLMPHLLRDVCTREDATVTLSRITALLVGIVTRTTYLELLSEFPAALKQDVYKRQRSGRSHRRREYLADLQL